MLTVNHSETAIVRQSSS